MSITPESVKELLESADFAIALEALISYEKLKLQRLLN